MGIFPHQVIIIIFQNLIVTCLEQFLFDQIWNHNFHFKISIQCVFSEDTMSIIYDRTFNKTACIHPRH